jgi:hypothetical protein
MLPDNFPFLATLIPTTDSKTFEELCGSEFLLYKPFCKFSTDVGLVIAQFVGWENPDPTTRKVIQLGNPTPNVTSM